MIASSVVSLYENQYGKFCGWCNLHTALPAYVCVRAFVCVPDPAVLNQQLLNIPGVLGTGLFIGMASTVREDKREATFDMIQRAATHSLQCCCRRLFDQAFIAGKDGNVKVRHRAPIARQLESADLLDGEKGDVEDVGGEEGRVENVAE